MPFHINSGRLLGASWIASPNYDARPGLLVDLIVIHGISLPPNQFGSDGVVKLFTNQLDPKQNPYYQGLQGLRVSAHLFIRRDGSVIQFVNFNDRAWHAGLSSYQGRSGCNDFSIGIELEGADHICYTAVQYQQLASCIKALFDAYPGLLTGKVLGHSDIAPGRKTDPGPLFNWQALKRLLQN